MAALVLLCAGSAHAGTIGCDGLPASITLTNTWLNGTNGIILTGARWYDGSGCAVSSAGDVNDDGYADFLVGAYQAPADETYRGETYLVYGRSNGLPAAITLTNSWLNGTNGVMLAGAKVSGYSGSSVGSAGDVNGDGFADFLVGAFGADEAYLVYGRSNGLPAYIPLTNSWFNGTNGVVLAGADFSGCAVSSAGDVNSDGYADFLVGAKYADPDGRVNAGETYLVYGRSNGLPAAITLTNTWLDGTNGVLLAGAKNGSVSGSSVSSAGDVNNDGYADCLVGAWGANSCSGETYMVYGSNGLPALITLTNSWLDGTNGIILAGARRNDYSGCSVSSAGDVNHDGCADFLVGAYYAPSFRATGETYLVYGCSNGLPASIPLNNTWLDGTNGIVLVGANQNDYSGYSVSSAGDVNGDGYADFLVGAYAANESSKGETYLVYGRSSGLPASITLNSTWLDGTNGIILIGMDVNGESGKSVSSAGDVNGDGLADFLIGAPGAAAAGEAYLVYGQKRLAPVTPSSGSYTGGYEVIIRGRDLSNGAIDDITNVTLCGVAASSIVSQSATQVVVMAGNAGMSITNGAVRVFSKTQGESFKDSVFTYNEPTRVVLSDFTMQAINGGISVCWQTASELDTLGFDVLRRDEATGQWVKVNSAMVAAQGWPNGGVGASYCVADPGARVDGTYRYKLVEYETTGGIQEYGPFERSVWTPRVSRVTATPAGMVLQWLSREAEVYDVLKALSARGDYVPAAQGLPATPPVNAWTDQTPTASGFYRVEAR